MREIIRFGFRYIRKFRGLYIGYLALCFLNSMIGISLPLLLGAVVNIITETQRKDLLLQKVTMFFLLTVLQMAVSVITNHIYLKIQSEAGYYSNMEVVRKIYNSSYLNILQEDPALLNQKINNDCNAVVMFCISLFRDLITNAASFILIAAILISQSYVISGVLLILTALYGLSYLIFKKSLYNASYHVNQNQSIFFAKLYNIVANMKSIRNNGFQSLSFEQQDKVFHNFYEAMLKRLRVSNGFSTATNLITLAAQMVLFLYGGIMVFNKQMSLGIFVILSNYFSSMIQTTNYFLNLGESYQSVKTSYDRVIRYDNLPQIVYGDKKLAEIQNITLGEVRFAYPLQKELFNISINLVKGKIYWIQGPNGTGKTTLTNVLLGLFGYDYSGKIELNGIPVKELDYLNVIKNRIAIVEQPPFLLSETFRNNLLIKTVSEGREKELHTLIREFDLGHFMDKQPDGMDTAYNALNDNISGGERQKLAVIRLLLSDADIWILDEPTSAFDRQNKIKFYDVLKERKAGHIVILISHDTPLAYDETINLSEYSESITDALCISDKA